MSSVENTTLKHIIHKVLKAYMFPLMDFIFFGVYVKKLLLLMSRFLMPS